MKKAFYWVSTILQIFLLIAVYEIQTYSVKKMGMMRYLIYMNRKWETSYHLPLLQYITIAILCSFAVIILIKFMQKKQAGSVGDKKLLPDVLLLEFFTLGYSVLTLTFSAEEYLPFYFISFIMAVIILLQNIKVIVFLKYTK